MPNEIDYRNLLKKYMEHILKYEGTCFIDQLREEFSNDEIQILWDLSEGNDRA